MTKELPDITDSARVSLEAQLAGMKRDHVAVAVSGGLICRRDHMLVLMRNSTAFFPDKWDIPGGKVRDGETFLAGFAREFREETGLELRKIVEYLNSFDFVDGLGRDSRQLNFLVRASDGAVTIDPKEHQRFAWVRADTLDSLNPNVSKETLATLRIAFEHLQSSDDLDLGN